MTDRQTVDDDRRSALNTSRRSVLGGVATAATGLAGVAGVGSAQSDGEAAGDQLFRIRIENDADPDTYDDDAALGGAVLLTPGAYAVYRGHNPLFLPEDQPSWTATPGLEAIAEAGRPGGTPENQPGLVTELAETSRVSSAGAFTPADTVEDPNDPKGEIPGVPPIAPGGAYEFTVSGTRGDQLTFASMFVPSNDIFVAPGIGGIPLYAGGEPVSGDVTDRIGLWDAGTEPNQQPGFGEDQAPLQDTPDQGADENGVVRPISEVDDGYSYPAVEDSIRVVIERGGPSVADYANADGIVTTSGLVDAYQAYTSDEISRDLYLAVHDAWQSGDPVT